MGVYRGLNSIKDDKQSPGNIARKGQKSACIILKLVYADISLMDSLDILTYTNLCLVSSDVFCHLFELFVR